MKSDDPTIFVIHCLVRAILLDHSVKDAYLIISKSLFPGAINGRFSSRAGRVTPAYLQNVCDFVYQTDFLEMGSASCYSASIVAQLLAFLHGIQSEMVIGVKKQDEKIVGHAWVELCSGRTEPEIVNPGRVDLRDYQALSRMTPEKSVEKWAAAL